MDLLSDKLTSDGPAFVQITRHQYKAQANATPARCPDMDTRTGISILVVGLPCANAANERAEGQLAELGYDQAINRARIC